MTTPERGSWQLKVDRAEQHFKELEREVRRYTRRDVYRAERLRPSKKKPEHWRYVLRITEQPDPNLAVIAGDVIHNLRSALDHIAVALAPKKRRYQAGFPIELDDIWAQDESGAYIIADDNRRNSYRSRTEGIPDAALTIIEELQPYRAPTKHDALRHPLGILSRLENADKHRQLIVLAVGLIDIKTTVRHPDGHVLEQSPPEANPNLGPGFADDGAEIASFGVVGRPLAESEVDVEVGGTPLVAVDIGITDGRIPILEALRTTIDGIRTEAFPDLEKCLPS